MNTKQQTQNEIMQNLGKILECLYNEITEINNKKYILLEKNKIIINGNDFTLVYNHSYNITDTFTVDISEILSHVESKSNTIKIDKNKEHLLVNDKPIPFISDDNIKTTFLKNYNEHNILTNNKPISSYSFNINSCHINNGFKLCFKEEEDKFNNLIFYKNHLLGINKQSIYYYNYILNNNSLDSSSGNIIREHKMSYINIKFKKLFSLYKNKYIHIKINELKNDCSIISLFTDEFTLSIKNNNDFIIPDVIFEYMNSFKIAKLILCKKDILSFIKDSKVDSIDKHITLHMATQITSKNHIKIKVSLNTHEDTYKEYYVNCYFKINPILTNIFKETYKLNKFKYDNFLLSCYLNNMLFICNSNNDENTYPIYINLKGSISLSLSSNKDIYILKEKDYISEYIKLNSDTDINDFIINNDILEHDLQLNITVNLLKIVAEFSSDSFEIHINDKTKPLIINNKNIIMPLIKSIYKYES